MNRALHKEKARRLLSKSLTGSMLVTCIPLGILVISLVAELLGFSTVSSALTIVEYLLLPLTATLTILFVKNTDFVIKDVLNADVDKNVGRYISTMGLTYLYTIGWTLLLFIPGMIKTYSYYLVPYILSDNPEMTNTAAITESRRLMDGRKMDMFIYDLSFILWYGLVGITVGIAAFYVIPYVKLTTASLYLAIKNEDLVKRGLPAESVDVSEEAVKSEPSESKEEPYTLEEVALPKDAVVVVETIPKDALVDSEIEVETVVVETDVEEDTNTTNEVVEESTDTTDEDVVEEDKK